MSYGSDHIDKAGRLPDWCEDDEDEGEDAGFEALMVLESLEAVAADGLVAAGMEVEHAEFTGYGLRAAIQVQGTALEVYEEAMEAVMEKRTGWR